MRSSAVPAALAREERGGGAMVRRAVARRSAAPGDLLGCLTADSSPAAWIPAGAGWWPRPRRVPPALATAEWS
eukprot:3232097-Pyramimonas_sp.AAC.1